MEELLRQLLNRLVEISNEHGELFDSEVRERIGIAVMEGFVRLQGKESVPPKLGMSSKEANESVRSVIVDHEPL